MVKPTAGVAALQELEHEPLVSNGENIKFQKGTMLQSPGLRHVNLGLLFTVNGSQHVLKCILRFHD